jgi:ABC-type phosphate transport system substrate-binding protein
VLDRETLGLIWTGEITQWNDQRIKDLNAPALAAKLPSAVITLGYKVDSTITVAEVFKRALSSFSVEFRTALAAANDSFDLMPPALAGHAVDAGNSGARARWAQVRAESV